MSQPSMIDAGTLQAVLNRVWSQTILEELTRFGVKHICIAPGSRSTPLTLEAQENSNLKIHTHFDERGLGFLAFGIAKASNDPVAIVVTSGTAVANLLPAIAESGLTKEKLVVLTADRPAELIDCGANQAINQLGIFSTHVTDSLNLPSPTLQISLNWLLSSIDQKMYLQQKAGGAVHINCPFPEPLYSDGSKSLLNEYSQSIEQWLQGKAPYIEQHIQTTDSPVALTELTTHKGIIVVGNVPLQESLKAKRLAEELGWPLLTDPQSGVTSDWAGYDIWLQNQKASELLASSDLIIQIGARLVSKRLDAFIKASVAERQAKYVLVTDSTQRLNPNHLPVVHIAGNVETWLDKQIQSMESHASPYKGWGDTLREYSRSVAQSLIFPAQISELELAHKLNLIQQDLNLFIGNSLIVRLLDMVGKIADKQVFTNRGASGIDGLVATAVGTQIASEQPLMMLMGDTSLLYDLNSLALAGKSSQPMVIVVTNNDGGAIFDLLPVPEEQKQSLYQMPHGYQFEHAAAQFGIQYVQPTSMPALIDSVEAHLSAGEGCLLVEVQTPPEQATQAVKELVLKTKDVSH
ncbi:2-succinyl-5-enolpyruvyl-6-hydroxy-3-cyclohexene-1-carboxylic-acid synthase [Vibrio hannami]|uniref:2-succinyl-5-enolpyruvyl-6-hydroxy-3- cyclohexene-1-carboxylic-acid synthase n=1 Tax=Vibrio hannami TaxID=2717094 RepID=UPI00240F27C6|nr:2-succinyl-5-enolpyruvyl-6-hydroxy-3-cyclohexene-1-carboxylic-acid synthase [Vibrio hannami]MDG3087560.1 2-succinyl-5-enolpyruvyl-6-hydroxy-3-cyclohexene-1-carboxylic-acid synthase [Vibrio hannami]